jgi:hypothetical protein
MGIDARMCLRIKGNYSKEETLNLAVETYKRFGNILWIPKGGDNHCIEIVEEYTQDGDSIFPQAGETILDVSLTGRYYGIGYERGNLPDYIMLAEFLEARIPNVTILYGGDSSGVLAKPFDKETRKELFNHFVKYGHSPYTTYFDHEKDGDICDLCKIPLIRNGWGKNYKAWHCEGCGKAVEERDGIKKVSSET